MQFTNNFASDKLSLEALEALKRAISTRGKRKGLLKSTAPKTTDLGYIGWQAIMAELCPARCSIGGLMFLDAHDQVIFWECERYCAQFHNWINENLQRPLEFNLYHMEK